MSEIIIKCKECEATKEVLIECDNCGKREKAEHWGE